MGNSSPSIRRATRSPGLRIERLVTPVSPKRRTCSRCGARYRSGMSRSSGWPITSAARQRNVASAARLKTVMRCASSMVMMASIAESTMPANRASLSRRARSAAARAIALASTLATDCTKCASSSEKRRPSVAWAARRPTGDESPGMATLTPETAPCSTRREGAGKRVSAARSFTRTGPGAASTTPPYDPGPAGTVALPTRPARQPTPATSLSRSPPASSVRTPA